MANGHGGKRKGAKRPKLAFKTKEIRYRITAHDYLNRAITNESYDQFFDRIETAAFEAINDEIRKPKITQK